MIVGLVSYPKSGNTWVRVFLANYTSTDDIPADINALNGVLASGRHVFDDIVGVEASDLTPEEIDRLRPAVYRHLVSTADTFLVLKVHDAYTTAAGVPLFTADAFDRAIYVVRNPLDVAVSLAEHQGATLDIVVERMASGYVLSDYGSSLHEQLAQRQPSWSGHVEGWMSAGMPLHVVRYEDMLTDPLSAFRGLIAAAGLDLDEARLEAAIEHSRFERLREQEMTRGFRERSPRAQAFFRAGRSGEWRTVLAPRHVEAIVAANRPMMRRFGYVNEAGDPV